MSLKNFVVKNGLTVGIASIDATSGNLISGNATLGNAVTANFFSGNGASLSSITGANVTGTVANATHASTANTVTTAAQPNITSVGTLSSLTVSGNASVGGILTDNYYYSNGSPVDFQQAAGSNTQLQFNNNDDFGASANLTFDSSTNVLKVTGNANVTNTLITPNISTAGAFTLTANGQTTNFYANGIVGFPANVSAPNFIGNVVGNITGNIAAQGSNTDVQFNDGGILGGSSAFTFNKTSNVFTVAGNVDFENADLGNLALANYVNVANDLTLAGGNISGADDVSANTLTGTLTTAAQPNVTSVGTLTSLSVTGNVSAGNVSATGISGTTLGGTLTTASQPNVTSVGTLTSLSVTGNVSAGNVSATDVSGTTLGGTLTTAAQPNVTSVGTLTSLAVTGNVSAGNVSATDVSGTTLGGTLTTNAQPNVTSVGTLSALEVTGNVTTSANLVTDLIVGKTSGVSVTAAGSNQNITLAPTGTGIVDVSGKKLGNLATPTSDADAATKLYVDEVAQGLDPKGSVVYATAAALPSYTYNNGTSGVGATITASANGALSIDGSSPSAGERVLVKNETSSDAPYNGIYVVTDVGDASNPFVLTRATDFDNGSPSGEIPGAFVFVESGSTNADTGWVCTSNNPVTVGTTDITFTQFSGAGTYTAGTGLSLNGTVFSISNTAVTAGSYGDGDSVATFTVNSQGQLTAASNVSIAANAANLTGSTLSSNVTTSSLTSVGTLGSLAVTGNVSAGNVSATDVSGTTLGGTLTTAAQPNITSVGTLTSLAVTGNVTAGNVSATDVSGTTLGGTLTTAAQPNITSVGTLANLTVSGQVTAGDVDAGNILVANYVQGTLITAAQPNITSTGILSSLTVSGNASAANMNAGNLLTANYVAGTLTTAAQPNITSVGTLTSLSVTGNVSAGNLSATDISGTTLGGTLTTAAQPNITSVGTLSSLIVTANITGGNVDAGSLLSAGAANISGNVDVGSTVNASKFASNVADGTAPFTVVSTTKVANLNADFLDGYTSNVSASADTIVVRDNNGNVAGNYFIGDGSQLTGIDTSLISNGTSNVAVLNDGAVIVSVDGTANVAVFNSSNVEIDGDLTAIGAISANDFSASNNVTGVTLTGTLTTNAQPNVTSLGTLSSLSVTNNILAGNVYANSGTIGAVSLAGTLTTAAQPNVTSLGTLTSLDITGNLLVGNISGANLVDANYVAGTLTTAAQPNITSLGTLTSLATSGNAVVGGNVKVEVGITSNRANVAVGNTATVLDEFSTGDWRTAKYVISGSGDDGHQSVEVILVHDGTNAYISIYGSVSTALTDLFELSANVNGVSGNVTVYATSDSDNCYLNLISQYIKT